MKNLGEFTAGKTITLRFNTHKADGTPITLAGTPAISVYKTGSTTETTTGVSLTVDYDSRTGLHYVAIDTSADGTFYASANDFDIVITAGTVDSISVVGTVVGTFSLSNRAALRPTTADRTLDVSAGGEAGVDWANVGSPTTTVALTGTTIASTQKVDVETIKTQSVTCAASVTVGAYVGGTAAAATATALSTLQSTANTINTATGTYLDATVSSRMATYTQPTGFLAATFPTTVASTTNITGGTITTVTNLTNAPTSGDFTSTMKTSLNAATPSVTVSDKTGFSLSSAGVQAIWDALSSALTTVGSIGKRLVDYLTGDIYGLIGATGSGLTSLAQASAWTGTRAAYLDKLNISGNVAASSEVTAIQNNTTTSLIAPTNIIRPASGTLTAKIVVYLTDEIGNMEAPDSAPTLSVFNAAGTDLSARLASTTGTLTATGVYTWVYASSSTDDAEEILFTVTVIEGGATRYKGATSWITDNASTDFTSSDRTKLNAVYAKLPTNNIADQTLLNTAISDVASQTEQLTFGTYGVLADMRGIANHATAVDTGTAGVVSFVSGAYVMTSGDTVSANIVQVGGENITDDGNGRMEVVADPVVADISARIPAALTGDGNLKADTLKVNGQTPQTLPTIVSFSAG